MKIIFLDNDGVICLSNNWGSRLKKPGFEDKLGPLDSRMDNFDPKAVAVLNSIIEETGAELVISSDWKLHGSLEEIQEMYRFRGIKAPIDITPNLMDFDPDFAGLCNWKGWFNTARIVEIKKWLEAHPNVTQWVAVDDFDLSKRVGSVDDSGLENFVKTPNSNEGIKQCGVKEKIITYLK
jgi:hypothetical protein